MCKLPKTASVCQRGAKVGTTLLVVAGRQPRGCREEEREIFHFPVLKAPSGWLVLNRCLASEVTKVLFQGDKS